VRLLPNPLFLFLPNPLSSLGSTPLLLGAGTAGDPFYALATFTTDLTAIRTAAAIAHASEQKLKTLIEKRNDVQDDIAPLLRDYRQAVASRFPGPHAFLESLPRYSPRPATNPTPRKSPPPPGTHSPPTRHHLHPQHLPRRRKPRTPHLPRPRLRRRPRNRRCHPSRRPAPVFHTVFHTASLLGTPGAIVSYKVYAITNDEREYDSEPATVQRPAS
jgi:hypothetical protein